MAMPPSELTQVSRQARLVAVSGPLTGEVVPLTEAGVSIGRDTSNDICLSDMALSRAHCTTSQVDGVWCIRDAQSSNGTFVNGAQVSAQALGDRDSIALGESVFLFMVNDGPAALPAIADRPSQVLNRFGIGDTMYLTQKDAGRQHTARVERDLRALLDIGTTITALTTEDDLHQRLLELLARTLPADQVAIVAADTNGEARIAGARQVGAAPALEVNRTVFSQAMHERVSLLTRDGAPEPARATEPAVASSILCVPLVIR